MKNVPAMATITAQIFFLFTDALVFRHRKFGCLRMVKPQGFHHPWVLQREGWVISEIFQPDPRQHASERSYAAENCAKRLWALTKSSLQQRWHDIESGITEVHQPGPNDQRDHYWQ